MIYQNVNGTFAETAEVKVSESGAWKTLVSVKCNETGIYHELLEKPVDCIQYTSWSRVGEAQYGISYSRVTTARLIPGFSHQFYSSVTTRHGGCGIDTAVDGGAIIQQNCKVTIDNPSSNLKLYINGIELTTTSANLVIGDVITIEGSAEANSANEVTVSVSLLVTIT